VIFAFRSVVAISALSSISALLLCLIHCFFSVLVFISAHRECLPSSLFGWIYCCQSGCLCSARPVFFPVVILFSGAPGLRLVPDSCRLPIFGPAAPGERALDLVLVAANCVGTSARVLDARFSHRSAPICFSRPYEREPPDLPCWTSVATRHQTSVQAPVRSARDLLLRILNFHWVPPVSCFWLWIFPTDFCKETSVCMPDSYSVRA
jgi:hypothetical protein